MAFESTDQEVPTRDMKASGVAAMRYVVNDGLKTPATKSRPKSVGGVSGSMMVHTVRATPDSGRMRRCPNRWVSSGVSCPAACVRR